MMIKSILSSKPAALLRHRLVATSIGNSGSDHMKKLVKGIVFDMDGTLTVPCIDFADMRRRVGVTEGDILTVIDSWPTDRRAQAYRTIAEIEEEALKNMQIMPGALEICSQLDQAGIPRALVTRNVSASVDFFHATCFNLPPFFPALSREWTPYKPDPAALHHIADRWGCDPQEMIMIGDSAKDDIVAGNRAGAISILLDTHNEYPKGMDDERLRGQMRPSYIVRSLQEVAELLQTEFELEPPPGAESMAAGSDATR